MKPISLLFLFISNLTYSTYTLARSECSEFANELADDYHEEAVELYADFEEDLMNAKKRFLKKRGKESEERFEKYVSIEKEISQFDVIKKTIVEDYTLAIRNIEKHGSDKAYCNDESLLERVTDEKLRTFDNFLEKFADDLDQRVGLEDLDDDEGLAVISAYAYGYAETIQLSSTSFLSGKMNIGPLRNSQYFRVLKLKKGTYYWDRVKWNVHNGYRYFDFSDDSLNFKVEPGKINFTGVFIYENIGNRAGADISDRSAILLKILEQQYPYIKDKYDWVNAQAPSDPFLQFYRDEKEVIEKETNSL